jgi:predicted chitinase
VSNYYRLLTDSLGVDLINKPELVATDMVVMMASASWWNSKNLNEIADKIDE